MNDQKKKALLDELEKTAVSYHLSEEQWNEIRQCVRRVGLDRAARYDLWGDHISRNAVLQLLGVKLTELEEYMKQKREGKE